MSRTIRRIKAGKRKHRVVDEYVKDLEDKEFDRAFWKFFTDNGHPDFGFEDAYGYPMQIPERSKRSWYKLEIIKWLKDPEHEIQFRKAKEIWDYC